MSRSGRSLVKVLGTATRASRPANLRSSPAFLKNLSTASQPKSQTSRRGFHAAILTGGFISYALLVDHRVYAEAPENEKTLVRLADVKAHDANAERQWIIRGTKVYDITDWIPNHPGGEVILRGVGGVVDSYWDIFSIHKKQEVYEILEQYYIGDIDPQDLVDGKVPTDDIDDPFKSDPERDPRLCVRSSRPMNSETSSNDLATYITPNETFYVRNHLWVPQVDLKTFTLDIELPDGEEAQYTLEDLKKKFDPVTITATMQCSGNRRKHMTELARPATGLQWDVGAISNAEWTGVRLRDVLADAGFAVDNYDEEEVKHVQFQGLEAYGASIPVDKAVARNGDVLLVYEMNGEEIPRDHGYPLRVLVPGHVAARSVKWLRKITLTDEESPSQWQQRDYKCFGPNQDGNGIDWSTAPAIQEMPVQSAITSLRDISSKTAKKNNSAKDQGTKEDMVEIEGYAYSGGGRRIVRVDVSADDGRSWSQAELLDDNAKGHKGWAWKRWRWAVPKKLAGRQFVVKAVDEGYNTQPEGYEGIYNFRGNLTSAWHRVPYPKAAE